MALQDMYVENFKANLRGGGARPNLFKATLNMGRWGGDNSVTSFLCNGAALPGSTVNKIPVPFRGREINVAGDRKFDDWEITVINDIDFNVRNAFERWLNEMNTHAGNIGFQPPVAYKNQMHVEQLSKEGNSMKTYTFVGVFPTMVQPIDLRYDSSDQIEEFSVTLAYDYWTADTTDA